MKIVNNSVNSYSIWVIHILHLPYWISQYEKLRLLTWVVSYCGLVFKFRKKILSLLILEILSVICYFSETSASIVASGMHRNDIYYLELLMAIDIMFRNISNTLFSFGCAGWSMQFANRTIETEQDIWRTKDVLSIP